MNYKTEHLLIENLAPEKLKKFKLFLKESDLEIEFERILQDYSDNNSEDESEEMNDLIESLEEQIMDLEGELEEVKLEHSQEIEKLEDEIKKLENEVGKLTKEINN